MEKLIVVQFKYIIQNFILKYIEKLYTKYRDLRMILRILKLSKEIIHLYLHWESCPLKFKVRKFAFKGLYEIWICTFLHIHTQVCFEKKTLYNGYRILTCVTIMNKRRLALCSYIFYIKCQTEEKSLVRKLKLYRFNFDKHGDHFYHRVNLSIYRYIVLKKI